MITLTRDRIALIREALASDPDPLITMDATDVAALCDTADQWLRIRGTLDQMRPGTWPEAITYADRMAREGVA